jgi:hypothetical protein
MSNPEKHWIEPLMLFDFQVSVYRHPWTGVCSQLSTAYAIPPIRCLRDARSVVECRLAWAPEGIQAAWRSPARSAASPAGGISEGSIIVGIDTRGAARQRRWGETHHLFEATWTIDRHGKVRSKVERKREPVIHWMDRNRMWSPEAGREEFGAPQMEVVSDAMADEVRLWIPANSLSGYQPQRFPEIRLGYLWSRPGMPPEGSLLDDSQGLENDPRGWILLALQDQTPPDETGPTGGSGVEPAARRRKRSS